MRLLKGSGSPVSVAVGTSAPLHGRCAAGLEGKLRDPNAGWVAVPSARECLHRDFPSSRIETGSNGRVSAVGEGLGWRWCCVVRQLLRWRLQRSSP